MFAIKITALAVLIMSTIFFLNHCVGKYGIERSISKYYIRMPWPQRVWFQVWVTIISIMFSVIASGLTEPFKATNFWFYISSLLLMLVAWFPTIKNPKHLKVHLFGVFTGIFVAFAGLWVVYGLYWGAITLIIMAVWIYILMGKTNLYFWIEIVCITQITLELNELIWKLYY